MELARLIQKYNVQGPRYTSYPTVPCWKTEGFSEQAWAQYLRHTFREDKEISLYIHLPYCERLCTYCGCNTRITINHAVERPYIQALLLELDMYTALSGEPLLLKDLHLGGGTPTFFSPANLKWLMEEITSRVQVVSNAAFSFEGHPANTSREHLEVLYEAGFRRMSLGIQDFDPKVQEIINREQSLEQVETVTNWAREIGYLSVNYDLIYGLPLQTKESLWNTITEVIRLKPDRIAFYGYAHVPWVKPGQRKFTEQDLPDESTRLSLYAMGRDLLEMAGYSEIGMDHFALPHDALYLAQQEGTLHRNFMGYTEVRSNCLIGLGVSSISDFSGAFAQNVKTVEEYLRLLHQRQMPVFRGHFLSPEDVRIRQHIMRLMCQFGTSWALEEADYKSWVLPSLAAFQQDGLLEINPSGLQVTELGKRFVRNICMAFDVYLQHQGVEKPLFSKTI
ncbi:MAG: oxygen-independent coproporphyrinogen III oxidase [Cytophagaceae bacterium]|nr:oxygen-independent coproporphyrinogen III oxidase [Cytophagaceae bacterium]